MTVLLFSYRRAGTRRRGRVGLAVALSVPLAAWSGAVRAQDVDPFAPEITLEQSRLDQQARELESMRQELGTLRAQIPPPQDTSAFQGLIAQQSTEIQQLRQELADLRAALSAQPGAGSVAPATDPGTGAPVPPAIDPVTGLPIDPGPGTAINAANLEQELASAVQDLESPVQAGTTVIACVNGQVLVRDANKTPYFVKPNQVGDNVVPPYLGFDCR